MPKISRLELRIKEEGYSLGDIGSVLKDREGVLILFVLIIRAIVELLVCNKRDEAERKRKLFFAKREEKEICGFFSSFSGGVSVFKKRHLFPTRQNCGC